MNERTAYWLLIERVENWDADQRDGFSQFGISNLRTGLANTIKKDDLLIFYVSSGISKFADVRRATADGTRKLEMGGRYDTAYPWALSTRPFLTLEPNDWVSIKSLLDTLSITRGKANWNHLVRTSLRRLEPDDGEAIIRAMRDAKLSSKAFKSG